MPGLDRGPWVTRSDAAARQHVEEEAALFVDRLRQAMEQDAYLVIHEDGARTAVTPDWEVTLTERRLPWPMPTAEELDAEPGT